MGGIREGRATMPYGTVDTELEQIARVALAEDAPGGDVTSQLTIEPATSCVAELLVKQEGVLAGLDAAETVFRVCGEEDHTDIEIDRKAGDGDRVGPGDRVALVRGRARTVLRAERPALNLLGHLSGIATLTRTYVDAAAPAEILCTRKTTPGLRSLERAAVRAGGGTLHRASLTDAVLIKDTHVRIAGGVTAAVGKAHTAGLPVEVEVETIAQFEEALAAGAERILVDNFTPARVREALELVDDPMRLEISGGVSIENVRDYVEAGARRISIGRLTHSAPSLDVSLEVVEIE